MATSSNRGVLYLAPSPLHPDSNLDWILPPAVQDLLSCSTYFIVEKARTTRQFLSRLGMKKPIQELSIQEIEGASPNDLLRPIEDGHDVIILSEAGCPGIADPGAEVVRTAHVLGITVVPLVGPSSILLGLMSSGFVGQRFHFHGYLPKDKPQRRARILQLEHEALTTLTSQLFIETPYRNDQVLADVVGVCKPTTLVCVAANITGPGENVLTRTCKDWQTLIENTSFDKQPVLFLISSNNR